MLTDTLQGLLDCVQEELDWLETTKITAPGAGLIACPNPLLAGSILAIRRTNAPFGPGYTPIPANRAKRRMVQFKIRLAQCVETGKGSTVDISGTEFNDRIEQTDNALYCCLTNGFLVENVDGTDETFTGYIVDNFPEDVSGGEEVTSWIVELEQCLEGCE